MFANPKATWYDAREFGRLRQGVKMLSKSLEGSLAKLWEERDKQLSAAATLSELSETDLTTLDPRFAEVFFFACGLIPDNRKAELFTAAVEKFRKRLEEVRSPAAVTAA